MFRTEHTVRVSQKHKTPATDRTDSPVRHALDNKGLRHKTVWIELYEIEPVTKKLDAKAAKVKPYGRIVSLTRPGQRHDK